MMKKNLARVLGLSVLLTSSVLLSGCASWDRFTRSLQSEFQGGLDRIARVYDHNGNLLREFEGRFDVTFNENRVLFDKEGYRIQIMNAIVIIEEQ